MFTTVAALVSQSIRLEKKGASSIHREILQRFKLLINDQLGYVLLSRTCG